MSSASVKSSRLVRRLRILYFLLPILITAIVLGVSSVIVQNISDDAARRISRQYAIEAAANFQLFMSTHLQVMDRVANSDRVAHWFANEHDQTARLAAFDAMMTHAPALPEGYYLLTAIDSRNGYRFELGMDFDAFAPRIAPDTGGVDAHWITEIAEAETLFVLNIQRSLPDAYDNWSLYIWSNHRVYYEGRFVGIFTLGSPFESVFEATFGSFYDDNKRGYIIDNAGMVRLDSLAILDTEIDGIPVRVPVPEAAENSELEAGIYRHLQMLYDGLYPLGTSTCSALPVDVGEFRYASIAPIIDTSWSIVVLSTQDTGVIRQFAPLAAITIILITLLIFSATGAVRSIVITPLTQLANSVTNVGANFDGEIYGTIRDDEIGDISRAVQVMLAERTSFLAERAAYETTKTYLDASPMCIFLRDENLNLVYCNHQVLKLFDLANDAEYVKNKYEFYAEVQPCGTPSKQKAAEVFKRVFEDGYANLEWLYVTPSGEPLPMDITLVRMMHNGKPHVIVYGHDLRVVKKAMQSERSMLEKERQALELVRNIQYHSPFFMEFWDGNENLIDCNEKLLKVLGCESKAEFSANFYDYCTPFQPCGTPAEDLNSRLFARAMETGIARSEWTFWMPRASKELPVEATWVRITYKNKPHIIVYSQDLRPLKAAAARELEMEMALHTQKIAAEQVAMELTRKMVDNTPLLIEMWSVDGKKCLGCNDYLLNALGINSESDYTNRWVDFSAPVQPGGTSAEEYNTLMITLAAKNGSAQGSWEFVLPGGEEMPTNSTWLSIEHHGKPMVIVYSQDLRPIKAALQSEESNKAKGRFLARMSHEIRTPITAILGFSEIQLRGKSMPPETEEAFTKIYNSSKTLLSIVNDILDFSRIESGKIPIASEEYSVAQLVADASQVHSVYSEKKDVQFQIYVDETLPSYLIGDALRLRQIIANFLTNAFKFTESGSVFLSVCGEKSDKDGHTVLAVAIQDTGIGMTPAQIGELRGEYVRHHENEMPFIAGTGLGIPIVFSLAELMDADVNISSAPGKGTNAELRISQEIVGKEVLGAEIATQLQNFETGGWTVAKELMFTPVQLPHGKVLVVDDVETNLHVAEAMLESFGVSIELVESAKEAIQKVEDGNVYDIIFMDYMMPEMNRLEATKILREDMGYTKPIVALTANALKGQAEMLMQNGFSGFMSKPVDIKIFNSYLMRFVGKEQ